MTATLDVPVTLGTLILGSGTPGVGYTLPNNGNTLTFSNTSNNAPRADLGRRRRTLHQCTCGNGTNLTVGEGGAELFAAVSPQAASLAGDALAVPEPGTLALLARRFAVRPLFDAFGHA